MGLFDKKFCDICGEKIGLLGNRKLADDAFAFLRRTLELGADVRQTDRYGRSVLMEAVEETSRLCPIRNEETGEFYLGRPITEEIRHDIRRIFQLLIDAGADRENRSTYSGKTIRQHYEGSPVWDLCGDLFDQQKSRSCLRCG